MGKASIENNTASASNAFGSFARNSSYVIPGIYDLEIEDTNWVLTSSFIIFTMQTGELCRWIFSHTADIEKNALMTHLIRIKDSACWSLAASR